MATGRAATSRSSKSWCSAVEAMYIGDETLLLRLPAAPPPMLCFGMEGLMTGSGLSLIIFREVGE